MATATRSRSRQTILSGPWSSVFDTPDPFGVRPTQLLNTVNCYIPDPENGSGVYQRDEFELSGGQFGQVGHRQVQGFFTFADLGNVTYNFVAVGGKLYRYDGFAETFTDVTPAAVVSIDSSATRVYFASLNGVMCVTDGVNRPWVAATLSATPITGAYINFDGGGGGGTAWTAYGPPVVYGGSGFFILNTVTTPSGFTYPRSTLAWSEAGDWTTGYQQAPFDNTWTLEQTGTNPLYALAATNAALYYFRAYSIGTIAGVVGPDLSANATHDAISTNVGTLSPAAVQQFGANIFFVDYLGRPYMMRQGETPIPIWHQMRGQLGGATAPVWASVTQSKATAAIDPTTNKYVVAMISTNPGSNADPNVLYVFDALTGQYGGQWQVLSNAGAGGVTIGVVGNFNAAIFPSTGLVPCLMVGGTNTVGGNNGYVWRSGGRTSGEDPLYMSVTTNRLGYSTEDLFHADLVEVIGSSDAPVAVTVSTTSNASVAEGSPTPSASADSTYRIVCGLDMMGRGMTINLVPNVTGKTSQWALYQIALTGTYSHAGHEDA